MDNLKLYRKSKDSLEALINTVRRSTDDIKMKFCINKCATLVMKTGTNRKDIQTPSWTSIGYLSNGA